MTDVLCGAADALLPDDGTFASAFAVWLLLRQMLTQVGVDADSLPMAENEFGKPSFDPSLGIHFSLSHADDRVTVSLGVLWYNTWKCVRANTSGFCCCC